MWFRFLPPFAPRELPRFFATMAALTPARSRRNGFLPAQVLTLSYVTFLAFLSAITPAGISSIPTSPSPRPMPRKPQTTYTLLRQAPNASQIVLKGKVLPQETPKPPHDKYGIWMDLPDGSITTMDWCDADGDRIDDRFQPGPGMPMQRRAPMPLAPAGAAQTAVPQQSSQPTASPAGKILPKNPASPKSLRKSPPRSTKPPANPKGQKSMALALPPVAAIYNCLRVTRTARSNSNLIATGIRPAIKISGCEAAPHK